MAFQRVKINDHHSLPSGAIEVPPEKVVGFYQIVIETWERPADIWALKYGPMILGAAGAFNGWYGNLYFRKRLKLRSYGFVSTYIPNIILPFVIVQSLHSMVCIYAVAWLFRTNVLLISMLFLCICSLCSLTFLQIRSDVACAKRQEQGLSSWHLV